MALKDFLQTNRMSYNETPAPGWVGGFAQSNPEFAYPSAEQPQTDPPRPNLTSLPVLDNLDNIDLLQRQQKVMWPEFSWETEPGDPESRCFQMFSPDISRLGYTNEGRVYSIICPQQGVTSPHFGSMNVEVTVTGQRGWADETAKDLAADMSVVGTIWFSPSAHQNPIVKLLWNKFADSKLPFPSDKANAIKVKTFRPGNPEQPLFPLLRGETTAFAIPEFARHEDEAWTVAHLGVEIGKPKKTGFTMVDDFNEMIMNVFNLASGNMLKAGNILTWNVWFTAPELVDTEEWAGHAEKWRRSINADHGSPTGPGTDPRYFDGTPYEPFHLVRKGKLAEAPPIKPFQVLKKGGLVHEAEKAIIKEFFDKHIGELPF